MGSSPMFITPDKIQKKYKSHEYNISLLTFFIVYSTDLLLNILSHNATYCIWNIYLFYALEAQD